MRELLHVRPSYRTRGGIEPTELPDAHRLVRNAIAIGGVIGVFYSSVECAREAVVRVENAIDDEPAFRADEVRAILELLHDVQARLATSLDENDRPRGDGGGLILAEARRPDRVASGETDFDRVFELNADGTVSLTYPRMSLDAFLERLPEAIQFLGRAAERQLELVWVE